MKGQEQRRIFNPKGFPTVKITIEDESGVLEREFFGESISDYHDVWEGLLIAKGFHPETVKELYENCE